VKRDKYIIGVALAIVLYPYLVGFTPDSTDTSSLEITLGYGGGATSRYAGSCFGDYYGVVSQPYRETGAEIIYRNNHIIAGLQIGDYKAEGASHTYYDEVDYTTREYDPIKSFYAAPFVGMDHNIFEIRIGAMRVNTANPNRFFRNGKGWETPTLYTRIGDKNKSIYFTFSYMSGVPIIGGGGYWNAGFGSWLNFTYNPDSPELWIGIIKQDQENTAVGIKIQSFKILNTRVGAVFSMPIGGILATKRTGVVPYSFAFTLTTLLGL